MKHDQTTVIIVAVHADQYLEIDCDRAVPLSLTRLGEKKGDEGLLRRPITAREKREIVYCTLAYGRSSILYRLFRLLSLSITKRIYPEHGAPEKPRSNTGSDTEPPGSTLNLT